MRLSIRAQAAQWAAWVTSTIPAFRVHCLGQSGAQAIGLELQKAECVGEIVLAAMSTTNMPLRVTLLSAALFAERAEGMEPFGARVQAAFNLLARASQGVVSNPPPVPAIEALGTHLHKLWRAASAARLDLATAHARAGRAIDELNVGGPVVAPLVEWDEREDRLCARLTRAIEAGEAAFRQAADAAWELWEARTKLADAEAAFWAAVPQPTPAPALPVLVIAGARETGEADFA